MRKKLNIFDDRAENCIDYKVLITDPLLILGKPYAIICQEYFAGVVQR
jgi:hypothetical protein